MACDGTELVGFLQLVCLELEAEPLVDLVKPVAPEERQEVTAQSPQVVGAGVRPQRPTPDGPIGLCLQPPRRVLVEGWHRALLARGWMRVRRPRTFPDPGSNARELVLELNVRRPLVPPASAAARAVTALVNGLAFAAPFYAKAEREGEGPVTEAGHGHGPLRGRAHWFALAHAMQAMLRRAVVLDELRGRLRLLGWATARPAGRCGGRAWPTGAVEGPSDTVEIETQRSPPPAARLAKTDASERGGVVIDPGAADAKSGRQLGRREQTHWAQFGSELVEDVGHTDGDRFDVFLVKRHFP